MFSILHRSILSPALIPSRSFKTVAATAASGEDMTTVREIAEIQQKSKSQVSRSLRRIFALFPTDV